MEHASCPPQVPTTTATPLATTSGPPPSLSLPLPPRLAEVWTPRTCSPALPHTPPPPHARPGADVVASAAPPSTPPRSALPNHGYTGGYTGTVAVYPSVYLRAVTTTTRAITATTATVALGMQTHRWRGGVSPVLMPSLLLSLMLLLSMMMLLLLLGTGSAVVAQDAPKTQQQQQQQPQVTYPAGQPVEGKGPKTLLTREQVKDMAAEADRSIYHLGPDELSEAIRTARVALLFFGEPWCKHSQR
jgi:hypothetical protein